MKEVTWLSGEDAASERARIPGAVWSTCGST
jgi:hypothetical protein